MRKRKSDVDSALRTETEQVQRRMDELFRALIENALDIIMIIDAEGVIRYGSPSVEMVLGYKPAALLGVKITELLHPDDVPKADEAPKAAASTYGTPGMSQVVEARVRHKDGSWRILEGIGKKLLGTPSVEGIVINARDITERKRAEDALRASSETRCRRLFETTRDGILVLDADTGQILDVNPFLIELLGYSQEDFVGKRLWEIGPFKDAAASKAAFAELQSNCYVRYEDLPLETSDGRHVDVEFVGNVYQVNHKKVIQCNIRDISERQRLEKQLIQAQKMEAVGRLAGGVAHDFNNLLTGIIGQCDLVLKRTPHDDPRRGRLEQIINLARRAAGLTSQLLAFSRKQILQPRVLDLNAVVADTSRLLLRLIGEDIELVTILAPDLRRVKADPGQIGQVIMNLAVNARDAMPEGGKLTIETANSELDECYTRKHVGAKAGGYVMLSVSDAGCGMDGETQSHIFEPFFTTKKEGKGTGLGLATVYGIVKQSGGYISVDSEPGQGATFKIYLPRVEDRVEPAAKDEFLASGGAETVLIAEDEEWLRDLVREILQLNGYTVLVSKDGSEALRVSEQYEATIHLLVTDIVMPGMNGRELARRLTTQRPNTKILYTSGYTDDSILDPDTPFLQKPFGPEDLQRKVRAVLDSKG